jgi:hypothetical protein
VGVSACVYDGERVRYFVAKGMFGIGHLILVIGFGAAQKECSIWNYNFVSTHFYPTTNYSKQTYFKSKNAISNLSLLYYLRHANDDCIYFVIFLVIWKKIAFL